uniref:ATP-dependent RNA helicase n=1 Tax=Denticeps clupeoides TaxID=299321 RepID=A0AAY4DLN5_9TELE
MHKILKVCVGSTGNVTVPISFRYLGDEEESASQNESRSKTLLAKLQRQAKERQLQVLSGGDEVDTAQKNGTSSRSQDAGAKRLAKKRKAGMSDQPGGGAKSTLKQEDSAQDGKIKIIKKRKKDRSGGEHKVIGARQKKATQQKDQRVPITSVDSIASSSSQTAFHILGGFENKPVPKVQRVLPQWLAQPNVVQRDIKSNLVPIGSVQGICPKLLKKLENNGIQHFFPVQAEVIPAVLESVSNGLLIGRGGYRPRDLCVSAPTGSGKTLAFVIPIVQALSQRVVCEVRALVVLPTKELTQQVYKVFCTYAEGTSLKVVMVAGQKSFGAEQASLSQIRGGVSRSLADIVVCTPGRLVDHISKTDGFSLQQLRFLVIDEADRMIDSMHQSWLSQVTKAVYKNESGSETSIFRRREPGPITAASLSPPQMPLQKLLFSATLTQNPEKLQQLGLHQPRLFSSIHSATSTPAASQRQEKFNFPEGLTEYYVPCTLSKKPLLLLHFLLNLKFSPVLCFTNSREATHRLYLLVKLFGGVNVAEFSSKLSPSERKKTLKDFEQRKIQLLISTDAAARGIDVNGVKFVLNYDAPQFIRTYIHRVGRTARAGNTGLAFTFLLKIQERNFLQMVAEAGSPGIQRQLVNPECLKNMEDRYQQTLVQLASAIKVCMLQGCINSFPHK